MAGSPTKKGNWGTWAVIDNPPLKSSSMCGGCIHYNDDGSCNVLPIVIHEVGRNYWKKCAHYSRTPSQSSQKEKVKASPNITPQKFTKCNFLSTSDGVCELWNSGLQMCSPAKCAYLNQNERSKKSCIHCNYASLTYSKMLTCAKSHKPIHDAVAEYCCYFEQKQNSNNLFSSPAPQTCFSRKEKNALREKLPQSIFLNKKVLLTGEYRLITRNELFSLLQILGATICKNPKDADFVISALDKFKTPKFREAQKLKKSGKDIRVLSEKEVINKIQFLLKKQ